MFTGIIETLGHIAALERRGGDLRLTIACANSTGIWADPLRLGESIAVSGVCLTVVAFDMEGFSADVSTETLARTTLGGKNIGDAVNLERALLPTTRLGGHLVAGHIDGVGEVLAIADDARAQRWRFRAPVELMRFIAEKGSIAIDGTSLTVNAVGPDWFEVALIPHTIAHTTFASTGQGAPVNLEVDLIARYVERLMAASARTP